MSDLISTDHPLNSDQRAILDALLDTLVPASDDGEMPSASEVGFDEYLRSQAEAYVPELAALLERFEGDFARLPLAGRCERVAEFSADAPGAFANLLVKVYDCYYQNDRVRERIGVVKGPLFPQGNQITPGDLSLLDPVIENSARHVYRKV